MITVEPIRNLKDLRKVEKFLESITKEIYCFLQ